MQVANDVIAELKIVASSKGYDLSDGSANHLVSRLDLVRLTAMPAAQRGALYAFLFEKLDKPYSHNRNNLGQIVLHEPDADTMIANVQKSLGKLRELWCTIFIGGCP